MSGGQALNLVPNPSFELYDSPPIGWFYKGEHFTAVMKYWSSPSNASPDVFGPKVRIPSHWEEKGFGKQVARTGQSMAGFTVYGCGQGKPHCREYLQIQLVEPLVVGQTYEVEAWVSHLPASLRVDRLGFHFSTEKVEVISDGVLAFPPQVFSTEILTASKGQWVRLAGRFTARTPAEYLLAGNFFPDSLTAVSTPPGEDRLPYGYYYMDDVSLRKVPPMLPVPIPDDDLSRMKLEAGAVVTLRDIHFEHDRWELMPRSYVELRKLLYLMQENPNLHIVVCGHTDNAGTDGYNQDLSEKRARSVVDYLTSNGIAALRTRYKGCGSTQPIASNNSPEGRRLNRRVEFTVLQME
ncbi:MAG: hypothetical protein RLY31_2290 [Bacteroidota bacterium]